MSALCAGASGCCQDFTEWPATSSMLHAAGTGTRDGLREPRLGIDIGRIDDHPEVHDAIRWVVDRQYFFGPQTGPVPDYGVPAPTWADAERLIEDSLAGYPADPPAEPPAIS